MSFAQGAPTQPLVLQGSNVFLYGSSTAGNAFTVQQLSAGNVASFQTSTNATALIINPAGNVGIGTTNPYGKFDILGGVLFHSNATTLSHGAISMSNGEFLSLEAFNSGNTGKLPIALCAYGGNVGIGVTNPAGRFSVVTSGDANIGSSLPVWTSAYMTIGQAAATTSSCVALGYNATSNFGILYSLTPTLAWREMKYHAAYHSFHMASDTPHVTINSTGIGIGTTNPQYLLHVTGPAASTVSNIVVETGTNAIGQRSEIRFGIPAFSGTGKRAGITSNTYVSDGSDLQFWTNATSGTLSAPRMTILQSGFVGIGTASPSQPFDVNGSARVRGNLYNADGTNGYVQMTMGSTTIPGYLAFYKADNTRVGYIGWQWDSTNLLLSSENGFTGYVVSGNLGVGVAPSSYKLQVAGTIGASTSFTRISGSTGVAFAAPGTGLASTDYNLILTGANDTANRLVVFVNGSARTADNGVNAVTIRNDSGNLILGSGSYPTIVYGSLVGIGTVPTNAAFRTHISGGNASSTLYGPNTNWGSYLIVGAATNNVTTGTAQVISTNGNLHLDAGGGIRDMYLNYYAAGDGVGAPIRSYGTIYNSGDIFAYYSDERLKTKVGSIENALNKVCSLSAFKYVHNEIAKQYGYDGDEIQVGLSAQEVQKILPEVVGRAPFDMGTEYDVGKGNSRTGQNYLTLKYERIVPLLVEALKEERQKREDVTCELRSLEERIKLLEQK